MASLQHTAVFTDNASRKDEFVGDLLEGRLPAQLAFLKGMKGGLFSNARIAGFIEEEARHESSELNPRPERALRTFSSGERKKALLKFLLAKKPGFLILDDPFDNLDRDSQMQLREDLEQLSREILLVQLVSRISDQLPCTRHTAFLRGRTLTGFPGYRPETHFMPDDAFNGEIPPPPGDLPALPEVLVALRGVNVSYLGKPILKEIDWEIGRGEFWELRGPNGSGKTTLITLITGDNPKAYGQEIHLFGSRKGSGESVWDIKEHIGYFTPAMADRFRGYHSVENMLISGLTDSVGLYIRPEDGMRELAGGWLRLLGLTDERETLFRELTAGQQRLVFCARAMIKHPPLLILDEPTAGLDEQSAALVVALIRKMARESRTSVVFVSHRKEPGLEAARTYVLKKSPSGSIGFIA